MECKSIAMSREYRTAWGSLYAAYHNKGKYTQDEIGRMEDRLIGEFSKLDAKNREGLKRDVTGLIGQYSTNKDYLLSRLDG